MSLKPLGLQNPLLSPSSLGAGFQPLQPLRPLGQNLEPLGQFLQFSLLESSYLSEDIDMGNWGNENFPYLANSPSETQFTESAKIGDRIPSTKSNSPESSKENFPQTTVRRSETNENQQSNPNLPATSLESSTENIANIKPLGLSKPLVQQSDFIISPSVAESLEKQQTNIEEISNREVVRGSWQNLDVSDDAGNDVNDANDVNDVRSSSTLPSNPLVIQPNLETEIPATPAKIQNTIAPSIEPTSDNSFSLETTTNLTASTTEDETPNSQTFAENQENISLTSPRTNQSVNEDATSPSNLVSPSLETTTNLTTSTTENVTPHSQTSAENQENIPLTSPTANQSVNEAVTSPSNLVSPQLETTTNLTVTNPEDETPHSEKFAENQENISLTSPTTNQSVNEAVTSPSNLVSPQLETATNLTTSTTENVIPNSQTFAENQEHISLTSSTTNEQITSPSNLVSPKLETATNLTTSTTEDETSHSETLGENEETNNALPNVELLNQTSNQEIVSASDISQQPDIIQPRLENQNLITLKPLGLEKPLTERSNFLTSKLIEDFINNSPVTSQEIPKVSSSFPVNNTKDSEDKSPNISRSTEAISTEITSKPTNNIPDSWANISELIGENTDDNSENLPPLNPLGYGKPLSNTNKFILPKLNLTSETREQPNNTQESSPTENFNFANDVPNSWSNISELLGENFLTTPDSNLTEDEFALETDEPYYTLSSTNISNSDYSESANTSLSADRQKTNQQLTTNIYSKDSSISEEQLEILAQKVYTLLRQRLEIEQERYGKSCVGYPIWLGNITSSFGTSAKVKLAQKSTPRSRTADETGELSAVDNKLQTLTREVYYLIRQRLEIEKERQGRYYAGRLNR
ncbi:hypothetical protein [Floridanema aerugineum]|uniref:Uncharacterized protein n=1 Tax=Floridaenema aerugineum BLCC-F46 TaxID=3153654 RepID=A0ABV4X3M5_9CYAN